MPKYKNQSNTNNILNWIKSASPAKKMLLFAITFAVIGGGYYLYQSSAIANPYDMEAQALLKENPVKGITYKGLKLVKKNAWHACAGLFEVEGAMIADNQPACTHGPDAAPPGVDMTKSVDIDKELSRIKNAPNKFSLSASQIDTVKLDPLNVVFDVNSGVRTNTFPYTNLRCTYPGSKRIQLIVVNNYPVNSSTAKVMAEITGQMTYMSLRMETQLGYSSAASGSDAKIAHFSFVSISPPGNCTPYVKLVTFPTTQSLNTLGDVINAMKSKGLSDPKIKYLVWNMSTKTSLCGATTVISDSSPLSTNKSNTGTGYAVVGPNCWSSTAEMHEVGHMLGAVQLNSPHTSGGYHCVDQHDELCYADGANGKAVNGKSTYIACPSTSYAWFWDCNRDDYFNASYSSSSKSTNYLHNHWNIFNSDWLIK